MSLPNALTLTDEVAIVDSRMPDVLLHRSDAVNLLQLRVVLVAVPDGDLAVRGLLAGARGIVYRSAPPDQIPKAVNLVRSGGVWAPRHVVLAAFARARDAAPAPPPAESLAVRLSERERDVFRLAAAGEGNKQIADALSISEATVKVHLTHIFKKLGVQGRAQLAAAYHGIIHTS